MAHVAIQCFVSNWRSCAEEMTNIHVAVTVCVWIKLSAGVIVARYAKGMR